MPSSCQVVEIVGVAGAGKSTLSRAICQHHLGCRLAPFLDVGKLAHTPYVLHSLTRLAPIVVVGLSRKPRMSWREIKLVIYINEWPRYIARSCRPGQSMFVLDQGPIYALGRLEAMSKPFIRSTSYRRWRLQMTETWAKKLTRIVFLDAPDPVLIERIGGRSQPHETKGKLPEVGYEFIGRHRRAFDHIVASIKMAGGPEAHRIDSAGRAPDELAAEVAAELGLIDQKPPG